VVTALLLTTLFGSQQTALIRFQPVVGKTYRYRQTLTMEQSMPGRSPMGFTQNSDTEVKALSRKAGLTTMTSTVTRVKVEAAKGSPFAASAKEMEAAGKGSYRMVIDSSGRAVSVTTSGLSPMEKQMAKAFEQAMSGGAQGTLFPPHALRVGETWTTSFDMGKLMSGMAGPVEIKTLGSGKIPFTLKLLGITGTGSNAVVRLGMAMKGSVTMLMGAKAEKMVLAVDGAGGGTYRLNDGQTLGMTMTSRSIISVAGTKLTQRMVVAMKPLP